MADWVLNFTKGGVKVKKQLSAQARELLNVGLWGVPPTAQAKDKLAPGDRVLVYVGAPEKVFIGDAKIATGWHQWAPAEAQLYPLSSTFSAGVTLSDASQWSKPIPLSAVWPQTEGSKTNPKALWYGAAARVVRDDFDLIHGVGSSGGKVPAVANTALSIPSGGPTVVAAVSPQPSTGGVSESDGLFKVAQKLRGFLADPKDLNEASTRAFFLDRVFEALGYSDFADIDHGSVVQSGDFPDYVLRSDGNPVIAVEAKRIGHPLGPKEAGQLVKYCSVLGLRWGLLCDGRYLRLYDAPITGAPPEDRLVLEIDLNDWADREDFDLRRWPEAAMLTKSAMKDGVAIERYAARELIRALIGDPASATLLALRKELEEKKVVLPASAIASLVDELLT